MRPTTIERHRRLYLEARDVIARNYRRPLKLEDVARVLASSPRQLKRAYAQCGPMTFQEDLLARRLSIAARLLIEQPGISVRDVARLVGFSQAPHFAKAFRARYGLTPMRFRAEARNHGRRTSAPAPQPQTVAHPQLRTAGESARSTAVSAVEVHRCVEARQWVDRHRARQAHAHRRSLV
jgi:AraC-like DNA-binding protein